LFRPLASVSARVLPLNPEYWPSASHCRPSTAADANALQVVESITLMCRSRAWPGAAA
jgi:hypothetical protein